MTAPSSGTWMASEVDSVLHLGPPIHRSYSVLCRLLKYNQFSCYSAANHSQFSEILKEAISSTRILEQDNPQVPEEWGGVKSNIKSGRYRHLSKPSESSLLIPLKNHSQLTSFRSSL